MEFSKKNQWWNKEGDYKILHRINDLRIKFILSKVKKSIKKKSILDVGCGGGLATEPLAKKGAEVIGIDENNNNLKQAKKHALEKSLKINYINTSFDNFIKNNKKKFDLILCLEVIEHVDNYKKTLEQITKIIKPGGFLILSTINRSLKSLIFAKYIAEYLLNWIPIGTHEFKKFLKPSEISNFLEMKNLKIVDIKGLEFNPIANQWSLTSNTNINYFIVAKK